MLGVAGLVFLGVDTAVIMVFPALAGAGAALAHHHGPASPAKEFCRQEIVVLGLVAGRGFPVLFQPLLYPVKEVLRDNGRDTAGGNDMAVTVFPDILSVLQKAGDKVQINLPAPHRGKAALRHILHDLFHGGPLVVADITFQHHGGGVRVDLITLVLVDDIAESGGAAVILAFQGVLRVAPDDLFGQFGGVVFRHALQHTFQDDTLRAVGNVLRSGQHLDAVLSELRLVVGAVVAVAGKAVKFPNDDNIKEALGAVLSNLPLEKQYRGEQWDRPETWRALLRRIHTIIEYLPDGSTVIQKKGGVAYDPQR